MSTYKTLATNETFIQCDFCGVVSTPRSFDKVYKLDKEGKKEAGIFDKCKSEFNPCSTFRNFQVLDSEWPENRECE